MSSSFLDVLRSVGSTGRGEARTGLHAESPRRVTRGESPPNRSVLIDWLNFTFTPADTVTVQSLLRVLRRVFDRPLTAVEARGLFGYTHGVKLIAHVGSRQFAIGTICYGGESQRGRWMVQLTGHGCQLVDSWSRMQRLCKHLDARITRVDLAADFLQGQHTVDEAVEMVKAGDFNTGGRNPSTRLDGDWLGLKKGRTLYVGNSTNGKMLRVYEKGRQLGNESSDWVRYEVQLGNRDRVIPHEVLTNPATYFAGAYPALESIVSECATKIATNRTEGETTLSHLMFHLRRSYGKVIGMISPAVDPAELVEELRVIGSPRRIKPSAAVAGVVDWPTIIRQFSIIERIAA